MLSTICTITALVSGQFGVSAVCLAPVILFFGLWYYRHQRDQKIVTRAAAQWQLQQPDQPAQTLPPMVSKGSNNSLFVPPPLQ
jgi:hypothetical protein